MDGAGPRLALETAIQGELASAQLRRIASSLGSSIGREARLAKYAEAGLLGLRQALATVGLNENDLQPCIDAAMRDSRLQFIFQVPRAAAIAAALAHAVRRAYGTSAVGVASPLPVLAGALNVVLDGLVDETPELAPDHDTLLSALDGRVDRDAHPCTALALQLLSAIGSLARTIDGPLRASVRVAAEAALAAELASVRLALIGQGTIDVAAARAVLAEKSECAMVVQVLASFADRGDLAPPPAELATRARLLGRFGGWIDDVSDVCVDLRSGRWSNVLLAASGYDERVEDANPQYLLARLASRSVVRRIAAEGGDLLDHTLHAFGPCGGDLAPMALLLDDVAHEVLGGAVSD